MFLMEEGYPSSFFCRWYNNLHSEKKEMDENKDIEKNTEENKELISETRMFEALTDSVPESSSEDGEDLSRTRVLEKMMEGDSSDPKEEKKDTKSEGAEEEKFNFGREALLFVRDIAICVAVLMLMITFLLRPIEVRGSSMYPTLNESDRGIANIVGYTFGGLKRFDIAIINIEEKDEFLVKRVVGLPGETIEYKGGKLYVNGEETAEEFLNKEYVESYGDSFMADVAPITLGEDEYFCLGDNRPHSSDSRYYGPFKKSQIVAKGAFIILPLNHFGVYSW